jgi:hypothetical protein
MSTPLGPQPGALYGLVAIRYNCNIYAIKFEPSNCNIFGTEGVINKLSSKLQNNQRTVQELEMPISLVFILQFFRYIAGPLRECLAQRAKV